MSRGEVEAGHRTLEINIESIPPCKDPHSVIRGEGRKQVGRAATRQARIPEPFRQLQQLLSGFQPRLSECIDRPPGPTEAIHYHGRIGGNVKGAPYDMRFHPINKRPSSLSLVQTPMR